MEDLTKAATWPTQGWHSFEPLKFHDLFHNLSEFSLAYVKQLFSKYCQSNLLFTCKVQYFPT